MAFMRALALVLWKSCQEERNVISTEGTVLLMDKPFGRY